MDEKWNTASICINSGSMSPQEICQILNIKETRSHRKGDPISKRRPNGPKRSKHLWILESDIDQSQTLDRHIEYLIEIIEKKIESFRLLLNDCEIEFFCGFSSSNGQDGFVIKSDLLRRLTVIPIDLVLDLYPPAASPP